MLVTSIFSFFNNVFYSSQIKFQFLSHYDFVVCECLLLAFSPFSTMLSTIAKSNFSFGVTMIVSSANALNLAMAEIFLYLAMGNGENAGNLVTSIFSFFYNVFYSSQIKFQFWSHYDFVVCKCFEFGQGQNFPVPSHGKRRKCW